MNNTPKKKPNVFFLLYITLGFAALIILIQVFGGHDLNIYPQEAFSGGMQMEVPENTAARIEELSEPAAESDMTPTGQSPNGFRVLAGENPEHFFVTAYDPKHPEIRETHDLRVGRFGVIYDDLTGNFSNYRLISSLITIYVFVCAAGLFVAFRRQIAYSVYSYNTIMYIGFGLFALMNGFTLLYGVIATVRDPAEVTMHSVYVLILNSAMNFLLFTAPFLVVFAILMIVSNLSLVRHEGRRLTNVLGILLSSVFLAADLLILRYGRGFLTGSITRMTESGVTGQILLGNLAAAAYLYAECMLIGAIIASLTAVHMLPGYDKDYMIILGCGMRKDGTPTPLLKGRCDRAIAFRNEQLKQTGKDLVFVPSGGKGSNEVISESACMRNYLISCGIEESRILMEDRSSSTMENMRFSKELIHADQTSLVAFSTTQYHVFRSGILARRSGMKAAEGCGARTKWYFWPNAWVREFVGLMTSHKLKQLLVLGGTVAVYAILSVLLGKII